jgi:hypothetical protein
MDRYPSLVYFRIGCPCGEEAAFEVKGASPNPIEIGDASFALLPFGARILPRVLTSPGNTDG